MLRRIREVLRRKEVVDPTPVEIPANARRPESLQEMVARLVVAQDFKRAMMNRDVETVEEANDFDIEGDDPEEQFTRHEEMAMALEVPDGGREAIERARYTRERRRGKDTRGEDSEGARHVGRVRRYESEAEHDDDVSARSRGGREDEKGGRRGDRDRSRDRHDGDGGAAGAR